MTFPVKKLGEVARYLNGRAFKKSEWSEVGLPIIRIQNLNDQESEFNYCNSKIEDRYHIFNGDILISWSASLDIYIWNRGEALLNQHIFKVELNEQLIDREYFFHSIKAALDEIRTKTQGATMKHITRPKFLSIEIPLPPLPEQKRIVKILDEVFEGIEKAKEDTEKNLRNSKELFESYLITLFTGTSDWRTKCLDEVSDYISRGISPKYIERGGIPVLNQRCIRNHIVSFNEAKRHDSDTKKVARDKMIRIGDVLINSTGVGTLGRVAQVESLESPTTVDSHITIVRPTKNIFYDKFFAWALVYIEEKIKAMGAGASGQTELSRESVKGLVISFPDKLDKQKEIAQKLDSLSAETKKLETIYQKKLEDLEELKKSVLKKAFSGEL